MMRETRLKFGAHGDSPEFQCQPASRVAEIDLLLQKI